MMFNTAFAGANPCMPSMTGNVPWMRSQMNPSMMGGMASPHSRMGMGCSPQMLQGTQLWHPSTDVVETDESILVYMDVPGVPKDKVCVDMVNDELIVSGSYMSPEELCKNGICHVCERRYGSFRKVLPMPSGIDPEFIEAKCENGLLSIKAPKPKTDEMSGRKISLA